MYSLSVPFSEWIYRGPVPVCRERRLEEWRLTWALFSLHRWPTSKMQGIRTMCNLLTSVTLSRLSSAQDRTEPSQSSWSLLKPPLNIVNLCSRPLDTETRTQKMNTGGSSRCHYTCHMGKRVPNANSTFVIISRTLYMLSLKWTGHQTMCKTVWGTVLFPNG